MPYVKQEQRNEILKYGQAPINAGELNFFITNACVEYLKVGGTNYGVINEIIGVLECAKQEFYRRVAVPYEDKKILDNGDCY